MKIILLNGPPSSGKDFAATYIVKTFKNTRQVKFAGILKEKTHALYGFINRPYNYYEEVKDLPNCDFYGITPRQAYINVSELYFKPTHGKNIFGKILAEELKEYNNKLIVISDSGFTEEAEVLIKEYGAHNIILVKIEREGHTFNGDSRSYLDLGPDICTTVIQNDGSQLFTDAIYDLVFTILND